MVSSLKDCVLLGSTNLELSGDIKLGFPKFFSNRAIGPEGGRLAELAYSHAPSASQEVSIYSPFPPQSLGG
jgi:hypothetical protein